MECPHCGAPMKDEQVFCEVCGKERLLVPEFDAQIDAQLQSTISGIADDLADTQNIKPAEIHAELEKQKEEEQSNREAAKEKAQPEQTRHNFSIGLVIAAIFAVVILILVIVVGFVQYNNKSYEYQMEKAEEMYEAGDFEQMLVYAKNASALAENSSDAKMMMARAYEGLGNLDYKQQMLEALLQLDPAYAQAYDLLIPMLVEQKAYQKIGELVAACDQQQVRDKYADYLTDAPQFSEDEGQYEEFAAVSVKLFAPGNGMIYYTMNGDDPTSHGREYMTPILLEAGDYEIKAVYRNSYGVYSEVVSHTYHIESAEPDKLLISLEPGAYDRPQYVGVENVAEEMTVYYTMDGSDPDLGSSVYTKPIPLPLGTSHFTFALYKDDTLIGECVKADYTLEVEVEMTGLQATNMLMQSLITAGKILAFDGTIPDMEGRREYKAYSMIEQDEILYYLLAEEYISPDGNRQRTGNRYAVNVQTGESFTAQQNETGIFNLVKLQ